MARCIYASGTRSASVGGAATALQMFLGEAQRVGAFPKAYAATLDGLQEKAGELSELIQFVADFAESGTPGEDMDWETGRGKYVHEAISLGSVTVIDGKLYLVIIQMSRERTLKSETECILSLRDGRDPRLEVDETAMYTRKAALGPWRQTSKNKMELSPRTRDVLSDGVLRFVSWYLDIVHRETHPKLDKATVPTLAVQ